MCVLKNEADSSFGDFTVTASDKSSFCPMRIDGVAAAEVLIQIFALVELICPSSGPSSRYAAGEALSSAATVRCAEPTIPAANAMSTQWNRKECMAHHWQELRCGQLVLSIGGELSDKANGKRGCHFPESVNRDSQFRLVKLQLEM